MMGRTFVLKVLLLGPMSVQTNDRCITIMIVATPNRCRSYTFINNIHVMMYRYTCIHVDHDRRRQSAAAVARPN